MYLKRIFFSTQLIIVFCVIYFSPQLFAFRAKNVILISIDALRSDHLSCYGYKRKTSPSIDKLASEGVLFRNVISTSNWTPPSLASIRTATYPYRHGVFDWMDVINPDLATIESLLKKMRYVTIFIRDSSPNILRSNDDKLTQKAIDWIRKYKNRNFFLWIHYFGSHGPYRPSFPYNRMYLNDEFMNKQRHAKLTDAHFLGCGGIPRYVVQDKNSDINYYISQYDGAISFTDKQIGLLLDELQTLGIDKDTIIIITADHGESLDEHEYYFHHGFYLYDEIIKIPLIIKYNNMLPAGKTINSQVRSIDIIPTILELLNIDKDKGMQGKSLLPLISGQQNKNLYAFSEDGRRFSIRTDKWKLIYTDMNKPILDFEKSKDLSDIILYFEWRANKKQNSVRNYLFRKVIKILKFINNRICLGKNSNFTKLKDKLIVKQISTLHRYYVDEYELYNLANDPEERNNLVWKENERFALLKQRLNDFVFQKVYQAKKRERINKQMEERLTGLGYLQ